MFCCQAVVHAHSGHDLDQLGRVAADDGQLRNHVLVQGLAGVRAFRRDHFGRRLDLNLVLGLAYLERDFGKGDNPTLGEIDVLLFPGLKSGLGDCDAECSRRNGGEIEYTAAVRDRFTGHLGGLVYQDHLCVRDYGSRGIADRAADRSGLLTEDRQGEQNEESDEQT